MEKKEYQRATEEEKKKLMEKVHKDMERLGLKTYEEWIEHFDKPKVD